MAIGDRRYTRIPPESSGDRLLVEHTWDVDYKNATSSFSLGDAVSFQTSTMSGTVARFTEITSTTGNISIIPDQASEDLVNIDNEDIHVNGGKIAETDGVGFSVYVSGTNLVGGNNPYHKQNIDTNGSAYVRFSQGDPELDSFGSIRSSTKLPLGVYNFPYKIPNSIGTATLGSGSVTYVSNASRALLSTSAVSGDEAVLSSHKYHPYVPGQSQLFECSLSLGDAGKANVRRRWGYFDGYDGAFFELDGSDLYVVHRCSSSGTTVDTRFAQSDWSLDTLDGSGTRFGNPSGRLLDLTNSTPYFISLQYPSGVIDFGIIDGGHYSIHRIRSNDIPFPNLPLAGRPSLPIRVEQTNTNMAASSSEMNLSSARVYTEGNNDSSKTSSISSYSLSSPIDLDADGYETFAFGFRLPPYIFGKENRSIILPKSLAVSFYDGTGSLAPVEVQFKLGTVITGGTWSSPNLSEVTEVNSTGTVSFEGVTAIQVVGDGTEDVNTANSVQVINLVNNFDVTTSPEYGFFVRSLRPDLFTSVSGYLSFTWGEVLI